MARGKATKKEIEYIMKYNAEKYDDIKIRVPKGKREEYKEKAQARGKSLNQLVCEYLDSLE